MNLARRPGTVVTDDTVMTFWPDCASSFLSSFLLAFDLLHPLHISGPRCTACILRGSKRHTHVHTGNLYSTAGSPRWIGQEDFHQMCYYGWEGGTGLVCPGFAWRWRYDDSDDSGLHFFLFGVHAFLSFHD